MKRILVTGAGGFIGHHLVSRLKAEGHWVRGVDIKQPDYGSSEADEFWPNDLRDYQNCLDATSRLWPGELFDEVYHLAADMGGIGYITAHPDVIVQNNRLIDENMARAAVTNGVRRFLYTSSACVYAQNKQRDANVVPLREEDAYPADPEPGYGEEKLWAEELYLRTALNCGLDVRIVRFHNVYGPMGTFFGGREKSPAAICRKVVRAHNNGEISIWGDGRQTRSYMYIDDCVEGLLRLMMSDYGGPLNLGTDELVSVDELTDAVCAIAGKTLRKVHDLSKPQGVRGRNSDNTRLRRTLAWEPRIRLAEGLHPTYRWIAEQLAMMDEGWLTVVDCEVGYGEPYAVDDIYKHQLILAQARKHGLRTFVETGTFRGLTTEMARRHFDEVYSVELSPEYHAAAVARFRNVANVHLSLGDSGKMLRDLLLTIPVVPTLFYLDAHPITDTAKSTLAVGADLDIVAQELAAILELRPDAVVLIDDVGDPSWFTPERFPRHRCELQHLYMDRVRVMVLTPKEG